MRSELTPLEEFNETFVDWYSQLYVCNTDGSLERWRALNPAEERCATTDFVAAIEAEIGLEKLVVHIDENKQKARKVLCARITELKQLNKPVPEEWNELELNLKEPEKYYFSDGTRCFDWKNLDNTTYSWKNGVETIID